MLLQLFRHPCSLVALLPGQIFSLSVSLFLSFFLSFFLSCLPLREKENPVNPGLSG